MVETMHETVLDRALGAYLGLACGDALGATLEFLSPRQIQRRYGVHKDITGGGWLGLEAGQVTDDTQMALALGEAILAHQDWNLSAVADHFVTWLESNPPDIGNTCRRGILRYRDQGILQGPPRDDEAGNGACMRNLPVVLATLRKPDDMETWTLQQCHITHHHPLSDQATLTLGHMLAALILGQGIQSCKQASDRLLHEQPLFRFDPYPGKASAYIVDTVQTVLHYFFNTVRFEDCLIGTVNQGGDADTTGALAGMLAGARYGLKQIPLRWLQQLDANVATQIRQQAIALLSRNEEFRQK